jgi:hypothetical protein
MYSTYTYLCLWYESLNSDGKQCKHISKTNNHLRALTTTQNTQTTTTYDLGNPGLYVCMYVCTKHIFVRLNDYSK